MMKKPTNKRMGKVLTALGVGLISISVLLVVIVQIMDGVWSKNAKKILEEMYMVMPEVKSGAYDDRINLTMASVEIDGESFCGILDVPAYQCALPVGSAWEKSKNSAKYPCRYTGSIYNGSMIIGGGDKRLDFMKLIGIHDYVYFIDTTGARYTYVVTDVESTKDVSTENLTSKESDLVIFSGNTYSMDYTVVRCKRFVGVGG